MSRSPPPSDSPRPRKRQRRLSSPTYDHQFPDLSQGDIAAFDTIHSLSQLPAKLQSNYSASSGLQDDLDNPFNQSTAAPTDAGSSFTSASAMLGLGFKLASSTSSNIASASSLAKTSLLHEQERSPSPEAPPEIDYSTWFEPVPVDAPITFQSAKFVSAASTSFETPSMAVGFSKASGAAIIPSNAALAKARVEISKIWNEDDESTHQDDNEPQFPSFSKASTSFSSVRPALRPVGNNFDAPVTPTPNGFVRPTMLGDTNSSVKGPSMALGFSKASGAALIPSSTALAKAREEMNKIWNGEDESAPQDENRPPEAQLPSFSKASTSFSSARPALQAVGNNFNIPATPTPKGFDRPSVHGNTTSPSVDRLPRTRPKPFKSPLLTRNHPTSSTPYAASPLNPRRSTALSTPLVDRQIPSFIPSGALAKGPAAHGFSTPIRTPASRPSRPAGFTTPFKPGMKPGDPGRKQLEQSQSSSTRKLTPVLSVAGTQSPSVKPVIPSFFNLSPRLARVKLESYGISPQQYSVTELESMGLNYKELSQITPTTAMYYCFHTTSSAPPSSTLPASNLLGPAAALQELLDRGCTLATQEWVDNHWSLILWKLAGLAAFEPQRESNPETKRWCWQEVIRQLIYRYERELNRGKRPPLRLVVTRDSPASLPMVLCISDIKWPPRSINEQGNAVESYPELEVTDGWYRIRAQVDPSLARAARNGKLRVGGKIGVVGARLSSEKKDPVEILEGYNSNKLVLSGNSCSLAPWHAKLGFTRDNFVRTLHSLSPDGGFVCALDFVVVRTHPVAFIEFVEDEDGNKHQEGPRNEAEEREIDEKWKRKREKEASKLHAEFEKKQSRYEGYIDRLERKAGASFRPSEDDSSPDDLDNLYDKLEDPAEALATIARLNPKHAGWLAMHVRRRLERDRESAAEALEKELENTCPPRNVKSFRVLVVEDAKTIKRPSRRNAQLTVWDVLQWRLSEGQPAGTFEVGHRYLVTNLNPTHHKAWMARYEDNAEVYLSTGRTSRWIKRPCTM